MLKRTVFLAAILGGFYVRVAWATPVAAATTASRVLKIIKALGKTSATLGTSAFAGVVSAKVMKDFEHAHDDAPALHVIAYYALVGNRKIEDASSFWADTPVKHLEFMKTFQTLELQDIKEISKSPSKATVWVSLKGKQLGKSPKAWIGTVNLHWFNQNWLITGMDIKPQSA